MKLLILKRKKGRPAIRVAKCHGYDGLIRVKILASWGKSLGEHTILQNEAFFGTDLHNLYEISLSKFYTLTESSTSVLQKYPYCQFWSFLVPKWSQFGRFHSGKIWPEGVAPCKRIDILQL